MSVEIYRQTKLGDSLVAALEDLLDNGKITPELAIKVLSESYVEAIKNSFKSKSTFKGKLDTYRNCEGVWTFILSDAKFKTNLSSLSSTTNAPEVAVDKVQIVCVDAKLFNTDEK